MGRYGMLIANELITDNLLILVIIDDKQDVCGVTYVLAQELFNTGIISILQCSIFTTASPNYRYDIIHRECV